MTTALSPLVRKFENYITLTAAEKRALLQANVAITTMEARCDLIREREPIRQAILVLDGFACRYKTMPDGRRQVLSYLLPGDMGDPRIFLLDAMDHTIATVSRTTIATWPRKTLLQLANSFPRLTRAFWWYTLIEEATARQWLVNIGQRTALERMSHLICELYLRLAAVDCVDAMSFDLPVTQAELGDALGLTAVHVNRTLQDMRRERLIRWVGKRLTILNFPALCDIAMFDAAYLRMPPDHTVGRSEAKPRLVVK